MESAEGTRLGIIDSLSAGYRVLVQRLELLLLPLLLDALLWFLPRLSIEPLLQGVASFYADLFAQINQEPGVAASGLTDLAQGMTETLDTIGESFNLFDLLVNSSLFHVPSLLVALPGLKMSQASWQISSPADAGGGALLLGLVGLLIGVFYMNLLARILPLGEGDKSAPASHFASGLLRHWLRSIAFLLALFVLLLMIYIPTAVATVLLMLISPVLGAGAMMLVGGLVTVILFYLYFVTVGLVLDNLTVRQAVKCSIVIVRNHFWPTIGFFLLTNLISVGITLLLREVVNLGPAGVAVGALIHAFVGTGLAIALLIFYRTRLIVTTEKTAVAGNR